MDRLSANEIAVPMMFPANTIKNPHHRPKKKPPPTARIPPGSRRTFEAAKSNGYQIAAHVPKLITRCCNVSIKSTTGKNRESAKITAIAKSSAAPWYQNDRRTRTISKFCARHRLCANFASSIVFACSGETTELRAQTRTRFESSKKITLRTQMLKPVGCDAAENRGCRKLPAWRPIG